MTLKAYLDSNILIAEYFESHANHQIADQILKKLDKNNYQLYLSTLTIDEFWYGIIFTRRSTGSKLSRKPYNYFVNEIENATDKLLKLNIEILKFSEPQDGVSQSLKNIKRYNLKPRDAFHLSYCLENKTQAFVTLDRDFQKLKIPGLKIISG